MKTYMIVAATFALVLAGAAGAHAQQTAEELYQAGLYQEEVQGNLESAIDVYRQILEDFSDNRTVGAKALLHIGLCYEKLGLREAQQAYQGVISDYPEAAQEVAVARQRLASLTRALAEFEREPRFRKIRIASNPDNGVLSPDGTQLAFVSGGAVWVLPVQGNVAPDIAGAPVRITESMGAWNMANHLAWSGDGKWIAFSAEPDDTEEIYVVSATGGEPRKIPGNHFRGGRPYTYRLSLSPTGETLAFVRMSEEEDPDSISIYTYQLNEDEERLLAPASTREPAYSPDGQYVAYIRVVHVDDQETGGTYTQLWVMPATGGTPVLLVDSTMVRSPVWSPDGTMIAVFRDRRPGSFSREIWVVPFSREGGPSEPVATIELPPRGTWSILAGWTPENEIGVHLMSPPYTAVYTVPVTGGKAAQITDDGVAGFPRWTPDGGTIVYNTMIHLDEDGWAPVAPTALDTLSDRDLVGRIRRGQATDYFYGLVALPADGGRPVPIRIAPIAHVAVTPGIPPGGGVHVSPDGKSIVFAGLEWGEGEDPVGVNVWTVPVEGGEPTRLARSTLQDRYPCWSADGKQVAFIRFEHDAKGQYSANIWVAPAEGGEPAQLTSAADSVAFASIAYSPDGEWLGYFANNSLRIMPAGGGESRIVAELDFLHRHTELSWSPDSERIAFTGRGSIWVVAVDGGEPVEVKTGVLEDDAQNLHIAWSPDGERIVFSASQGGDVALWLISDFLPEER
ncbi:MAG: PD40 domain-containing protein [Gemmatimonadota bacterium]|nr:MAG: PD40 domain-containing protein [Gemmatimonadota bacterium]